MDLRDPVSSASHLLTAVWAVFATLVLLRLTRGGWRRRAAVGVYGLSMVLLYLASGTFHGLRYESTAEFRFFQKLDQSAIFLLIAGTNTPLLVMVLGGAWGRWFLGTMWGLAAAGILTLWTVAPVPHTVLVGIYLGMGWLGLLPVAHYYRVLGAGAMNLMWLGAGLYTAGAVCELAQWPVLSVWPVRFGFHEVLHLSDTAASVVFFLFITRHVVPHQRREPEPSGGTRELPLAA